MRAMIGDAKRRSEGFSGFPAGSLPDPRFLPIVGPKSMISGDFFGAGGTPKNFTLSFPARQGNRRGGATLPASAPLGPSRPGTRGAKAGYWGCCSCRCLSFRAKKRFGGATGVAEPNWATRAYLTGPIGGIVSTAELSSSICRRCSSGCAAFNERSIDPELAPPSSPSRSLPNSRS
jgi:hypothetical protein